jgi:hypothetical protein
VHLAQVGQLHRGDPESGGERRRGLVGPLHGGHVDRVDRLAGAQQPFRRGLGLGDAVRVERRVTLPVDHRVRDALDVGGRLAVADEQDLARAGRPDEA